MKTKSKNLKDSRIRHADDYDAVKSMREIRDKISHEIADMNFAQLKKYFKEKRITRAGAK